MQVDLTCAATGDRKSGFRLLFKLGNIPIPLDMGEEAKKLINESPSQPLVEETQNAHRKGFHVCFSDADGKPRVMDIWTNQEELQVWMGPAPGDCSYDPRTGLDTGW